MKIKNYIKAAISIGLLYFLFIKIDFSIIKKFDANIAFPFLLSLIITLGALFVMSFRWKLLSFIIKKRPKITKLYSYYLKGMFYNIFLPGAIGGDIVRTKDFMKEYDVKLKQAAALTAVERITGLYVLFVLCFTGLIFGSVPFQIGVPHSVLFLILLAIIFAIPFVKWVINKKINISYRLILVVLLFSFFGQLGDVLIAYVFSSFLGVELLFSQFLIIMPIVYFVTVLPISLGGLGVREGTFVGILSLYSIESSVAIVISFLMYLVKISVGLVGWVIFLKTKKCK